MNEFADYIQRIEIKALWGRKKIVWELRPDVNILSGINGIGKSTILNESVGILTQKTITEEDATVKMTFHPKEAKAVRFDVIRSFDRPLLHGDLLEKLSDRNVQTELDWQLYQLQRRYLDYQVNIGNRIIAQLSEGTEEGQAQASRLAIPKKMFQDIIDDLFSETGKKILRGSNEIMFDQAGETLNPYQLSSGEKQMLVILLTVLVQDNQPTVLFMDEPEVSLHIEWQQQLIRLIRSLNGQVQIILTTHSPAMVMDGWQDAVTEVSDITV
ncbi:MAG: ATP-binding protein [Bacteroidaceae bacterium]|nr:ATP-binding protein [Bacteroidaceae bacterium]